KYAPRRGLFFIACGANRVWGAVEIRNQVREILRRDILLQPFGHERQSGRTDVGEVAAQNFFIDPAGLGQGYCSGRFSAYDAGQEPVVPGLDVISNESGLDCRVWVENSGKEIGRCFVSQRAEVRTDAGAFAPKVVADHAIFRPDASSFDGIT